MEDLNTLEKLEEYFKKINCYGEYNYCFTILKNKTKYTMKTLKKIKNIEYHEINLNNFLSICK